MGEDIVGENDAAIAAMIEAEYGRGEWEDSEQ